MPQRHDLPRLDLSNGKPAVAYLGGTDYRALLNQFRSPTHGEITETVKEAFVRSRDHPVGIKAGTGTGKTLSCVLAALTIAAQLPDWRCTVILDSQQSVNSMWLSLTGTDPELEPGAFECSWNYDSIVGTFEETLPFNLDAESLGATHGGIRNRDQRSGRVILSTAGSWEMRELRSPSDMIIVDEADKDVDTLGLAKGIASIRKTNVIGISATLPEGLLPVMIEGPKAPQFRVTRVPIADVISIVSILISIEEPSEGTICLVIRNSIWECMNLQEQYVKASGNMECYTYDGMMSGEEKLAVIEKPEAGLKVVISTRAIARADLKGVGGVLIPSEAKKNVLCSNLGDVLSEHTAGDSEIEQYSGRMCRNGHPPLCIRGRSMGIYVLGPSGKPQPNGFVGNAFELGMRFGRMNVTGFSIESHLTEGQAFAASAGMEFALGVECRNPRLKVSEGSSFGTLARAVLISSKAYLYISKEVLKRNHGPELGKKYADALAGWYEDFELFTAALIEINAEALGLTWVELQDLLVEDDDLTPDWEDIADRCPDYVLFSEEGTVMTLTGTIINGISPEYSYVRVQQHGKTMRFHDVPIEQRERPYTATRVYGIHHSIISGDRRQYEVAFHPSGGNSLNIIRQWREDLKSRFNPEPSDDDYIATATRGWSLADYLSVLLLTLIKELQGSLLGEIMASAECREYIESLPSMPYHTVSGVNAKFGVEALRLSFDCIRFTMNPVKTWMSVVAAAPALPVDHANGVAYTLSSGDDGGDLIAWRDNSITESRGTTSMMNFTQNLTRFTGSVNSRGEVSITASPLLHQKTQSWCNMVHSLNPWIPPPENKRNACRMLTDFSSLGPTQAREQLIEVALPYILPSVTLLREYGLSAGFVSDYLFGEFEVRVTAERFARLVGPQHTSDTRDRMESIVERLAGSGNRERLLRLSQSGSEKLFRFWESLGGLVRTPPKTDAVRYYSGCEIVRALDEAISVPERELHIPIGLAEHLNLEREDYAPDETMEALMFDGGMTGALIPLDADRYFSARR